MASEKRTAPPRLGVPNKSALRGLLLLLVLLFAAQFAWNWMRQSSSLPYSTFRRMLAEGRIARVEFDRGTITATARGDADPPGDAARSASDSAGTRTSALADTAARTYTVVQPAGLPDDSLMVLLARHGVIVEGVPDTSQFWNIVIWIVLPAGLMIGFFVLMNARLRGQGGSGGILSMGKMNAEAYSKERVKTTFADVAGMKEQKEALFEIIHFLKRPEDFRKLGGTSPRGVLLVGPPGTGKTLLARAVAGEADVPFFHVAGSAFLEMLVGVGASRVRDLFRTAKKSAPCIVFVDEIDSIGRRRGGIQGFYGGGASEMEQTLNQLLSEMDGFEPNEDIIVMAATNQPDVLDPALLRPGRFDRRISVDLPNLSEREDILRVHARNVLAGPDVDLHALARATPGNSGADLKNLVNEAAILASKKRKDAVEHEDFLSALETIVLGYVRSSLVLSEEEKRRTAFHEAGHALVAMSLPTSDPVTRVTIVPRGRALGVTMQTPLDERHNYTKDYLVDRLAVLLAGRASEMLVFDSVSTGAENDLVHCTTLARNMVARYGMSERLGTLSLMDPAAESYLGDNPLLPQRNFSELTLQVVDAEIKHFVDEALATALRILTEKRALLDAVAAALLQLESLEGADLDRIIESGRPPEQVSGERSGSSD
jgi:cell division protease FtsH